MCQVFMDACRAEGLVCHPETSGWDVLVVDPGSGEQAGIEAKRRPNVDVLHQASRRSVHRPGPCVHAVLVPSCSRAFAEVARALRLVVVEGRRLKEGRRQEDMRATLFNRRARWEHVRPAWAPPCEVLGARAGEAGPLRITPWKVKAVTFAMRLRANPATTRAEVLAAGMAWGVWSEKWLEPTGERKGRSRIYRPRDGVLLPDAMYPRLAEALELAAAERER